MNLLKLSLLFLCLSLGAADKKGESTAAIGKAAQASEIRAQGMPPFTLKAKVRFYDRQTAGDLRQEGSYRLDWASPEAWREEIATEGYQRVLVHQDATDWTRAAKSMPLWAYQTRQLVRYPMVTPETIQESRAANVQLGGKAGRCFSRKDGSTASMLPTGS